MSHQCGQRYSHTFRSDAAAPFICGFLVALALYVGFTPLRVQATPTINPALWTASQRARSRLDAQIFRDGRRLIDVVSRVRRDETPARNSQPGAAPASYVATNAPLRLRRD